MSAAGVRRGGGDVAFQKAKRVRAQSKERDSERKTGKPGGGAQRRQQTREETQK